MTFMRTNTLRNGMKRHNESRDISTKGGRMLPNCQDTEECWDARTIQKLIRCKTVVIITV